MKRIGLIPRKLNSVDSYAGYKAAIPIVQGVAYGNTDETQNEENKTLKTLGKIYGFAITPLAMGVGYYRTKSILKAFGVSFVALPYLIYVGIDVMSNKDKKA